MHHLLKRLAPILRDIETSIESDGPRPIETKELEQLFQRHSGKTIIRIPSPFSRLQGAHLSFPDTNTFVIFHRSCNEAFDRSCPHCQAERFAIAKELIHIFDDESEKTLPIAARADLLEQIVAQDFSKNGSFAEFVAELGAIELLAPYIIRKNVRGGFNESRARSIGDYSAIARQFCLPSYYAQFSFMDNY